MRASQTPHGTLDWRSWLQSLRSRPPWSDADYPLPDLCHGEGVIGMLVIAQLLALSVFLAAGGLHAPDWVALGRLGLMTLAITLLNAMILSKVNRFLAGVSRALAVCVCYGLIVFVVLLCSGIAEVARSSPPSAHPFDPAQITEDLLLAAVPAAIVLNYLLQYRALRKQEQAELQARIQALQSRIRPHFLYNCMNLVASLIGSDPDKAERVVEDLSDLFRHALADAQTLTPLREELALCRSYLALEQLRLGERLQVVWEISDYGTDARIPCLTLQPVLENAIYHGIQLSPAGGEIRVGVRRVDERMEIIVRNPSCTRMQYHRGAKMALENVRLRLQAHFGADARVTSEARDGSYTTTLSYSLAGGKQRG